MLIDDQILNRLKEIMGLLYDPTEEEMYLRVVKRVMEEQFTFQEPIPLIPKVFEGVDWNNIRVIKSLGYRLEFPASVN